VKNEARGRVWYAAKFRRGLQPYKSVADAISTFPTRATAIGLQPTANHVEACAAYGLGDLLGLVVRPNKQMTKSIYDAKVTRWPALWPGLHVISWNAS
jgi:uncharacterized protein